MGFDFSALDDLAGSGLTFSRNAITTFEEAQLLGWGGGSLDWSSVHMAWGESTLIGGANDVLVSQGLSFARGATLT